MKTRPFGSTGEPISEVGLGTWQLGAADWGAVDQDDALAILRESVDLGVNFFDTADVYGMGVSERTIGLFLREAGDAVRVATKLGRRSDGENGWPANFTLDAMRRHTQQSLKHLGVETIFLQQLHCIPTDELRRGEVFDHLRALQREGLIQHWGVSVESVEEGLICLEHADCAALQVIFSIFRQKPAESLLPRAQAAGTAILARVPLASGLLSGRFTADHAFPEQDHRSYNADGQAFNVGETFAGLPFTLGVELAEEVRAILDPQSPPTMAQLALRWILDHDAVTTVIPGASRPEQARLNAAACDLPPLSQAVHDELRALHAQRIAPAIRGPY